MTQLPNRKSNCLLSVCITSRHIQTFSCTWSFPQVLHCVTESIPHWAIARIVKAWTHTHTHTWQFLFQCDTIFHIDHLMQYQNRFTHITRKPVYTHLISKARNSVNPESIMPLNLNNLLKISVIMTFYLNNFCVAPRIHTTCTTSIRPLLRKKGPMHTTLSTCSWYSGQK